MQSCWHKFFGTNVSNAIVPKHCVPKIGQTVFKCWAMGHARAKICWLDGFSTRHEGFYREKPFVQRSLGTEELLRREVLTQTRFTHRSFYTQTRLHTEGFTNRRSFGAQKLLHRAAAACTQKLLHKKAFTQRSFCTQELLHKKTFIQESFYTQKLSHTEALYTEKSYTEELLRTDAFTQRSLYTEELLHTEAFYAQNLLHKVAFTQRSLTSYADYTEKLSGTEDVYTEKSLHRGAFTHRRVYTEKSLHRGAFAHRIMTITRAPSCRPSDAGPQKTPKILQEGGGELFGWNPGRS